MKKKHEKTGWEKFQNTLIYFILLNVVISILVPFFIQGFLYAHEHGSKFFETILRLSLDKYNFIGLLIGFLFFILSLIHWILIKNETKILGLISNNETKILGLISNTETNLDKKFEKAKIIFETSISAFDMPHIKKLQDFSESWTNVPTDKSIYTIYAIDYSAPLEWWNESMTAYLAVLSKWKNIPSPNKIIKKNVKRLFVYTKQDLITTLCVRTLFFHIQLGFETYLISYDSYQSLFKKITSDLSLNEIKNNGPRELLIWDIFDSNKNLIEERLAINNKTAGFESYWKIDEDRKSMIAIKKKYKEDEKVKVHTYSDQEHDAAILFEDLTYYKNTNGDSNHELSNKIINQQISLVKDGIFDKSNKYFKKINSGEESLEGNSFYGLFLDLDKPDTTTIKEIINNYINKIF